MIDALMQMANRFDRLPCHAIITALNFTMARAVLGGLLYKDHVIHGYGRCGG